MPTVLVRGCCAILLTASLILVTFAQSNKIVQQTSANANLPAQTQDAQSSRVTASEDLLRYGIKSYEVVAASKSQMKINLYDLSNSLRDVIEIKEIDGGKGALYSFSSRGSEALWLLISAKSIRDGSLFTIKSSTGETLKIKVQNASAKDKEKGAGFNIISVNKGNKWVQVAKFTDKEVKNRKSLATASLSKMEEAAFFPAPVQSFYKSS